MTNRSSVSSATARERLPNRRLHELLTFEHAGFLHTAGIGRFDDGRLAEVFLDNSKVGTAVDAAARDAAIVASPALQHGTPAETIRHAVTRNREGARAAL